MQYSKFKLETEYVPTGDQPQAIEALVAGINSRTKYQTLLGVTGSGKTFTVANVIAETNRPALILAPNKTLAAQLYAEMKELFPNNAVEFFVSYYDYYQPEAYVPASDTYIEKDSSINERIDKLRHAATYALLERNDVIIVASISCIYGLGSPEAYQGMLLLVEKGETVPRDKVLRKLVEIQYQRNDLDFHRGTFRVRGDTVEIFPTYWDDQAVRIEFWGDEVEAISIVDPLRGKVLNQLPKAAIYPASHYVMPLDKIKSAVTAIQDELRERLQFLRANNRLVEAQRLEQRTMFDIEMIEEMGYCNGIENYSRHMEARAPNTPPPTLLDFFPSNWLMFIDESHVSVPQAGGMYRGDRSRKMNLVEYGFRLPSALDNRPLTFEEFEERLNQVIFVSATPQDYELEKSEGIVVEQIIRPTGLVDPEIEVRPAGTQVDDCLEEIRLCVEKKQRVLITVLTKRMAEDLAEYYANIGVRVKYLHSEIDTLERLEIIRDLRLGVFDVLIGINLLREGLDIPEVALVAIMDADKEGFLRNNRSLIQTVGRAARNVDGRVIFYADRTTKSMTACMEETTRRRNIQLAYNEEHGITPETIKKSLVSVTDSLYEKDYVTVKISDAERALDRIPLEEIPATIIELRREMKKAASDLEFEKAAEIRDRIRKLEERELLG